MNRIRRVCAVAFIVATLVAQGGCASRADAAHDGDPRDEAHAWRVRRGPFFDSTWGVEVIGVKLVSSGWMLQFKYRVTDSVKAKELFDHGTNAYLTDEPSGAKLSVPTLDNVGALRQMSEPEQGRTYYIVFGNASKIVQRGNRVSIEIGRFVADDLIVE